MTFPLPKIGARVRVIENDQTTNWTRIDTGRIAIVTEHKPYSFRAEYGPRVHILAAFEAPAKWDRATGRGVYFTPGQLEPIQRMTASAEPKDDIVIEAQVVRYARAADNRTRAVDILDQLKLDFPGVPEERLRICMSKAADRLLDQQKDWR